MPKSAAVALRPAHCTAFPIRGRGVIQPVTRRNNQRLRQMAERCKMLSSVTNASVCAQAMRT